MLRAAFKQNLAERWLLNGILQPGNSEMDGLVPDAEPKDDEGDDSGEIENREDVDADESSNKLPQVQADLGPASPCSPSCIGPSRAAGLRSQCISENIGVSEKAQ